MARSTCLHFALSVLLAAALPGVALAQAYPSKPVKIVVPAQPGGGLDLVGRTIAEQLGSALEQRFGFVLGEYLAARLRFGRVTHVRERYPRTGACEYATERDRVVLVVGSVVGNDDVGGHIARLLVPFRLFLLGCCRTRCRQRGDRPM